MGHRSSKSAIANSTSADFCGDHNSTIQQNTTSSHSPIELWNSNSNNNNIAGSSSNRIPIPLTGTTINVQIQESPTTATATSSGGGAAGAGSAHKLSESDSSSLTSLTGSNSLQNRQIIIKIQLAKMENGNELSASTSSSSSASTAQQENHVVERSAITTNTKSLESTTPIMPPDSSTTTQFVNLTLNGHFIYNDEDGVANELLTSLPSTSSQMKTTAGSSTSFQNNNNKSNYYSNTNNNNRTMEQNRDLEICLNALHIQEDWERQQANDGLPEYCEVMEESLNNSNTTVVDKAATTTSRRSDSSLSDTVGCINNGRRKSKTSSSSRPSSTSSLSSVILSKRRCRDAIKRMLEPSAKSSTNKNKEHNNKRHSENLSSTSTVLPSTSSGRSDMRTQSQNQNKKQLPVPLPVPISTPASSSNHLMPISITTIDANSTTTTTINSNVFSRDDIIITPRQFVVVQCAPSSVVTLNRIDDNAIRLTSTEVGGNSNGFNGLNSVNGGGLPKAAATTKLTRSMSNGPIVHSQVDFVHCLVPDLDKIVNSSFYWGKIDRYEAERLLEGKPEGTFLLRDSAQDEYLFSVTFRKYGRSLHARIEQSGHKFGFDCHDPGVFTAPTVTGLLQHYKDPAIVMFFEPMLTIPLHRKTVFSLQELARSVIVSNTTYDGINELGLPVRVKIFLKEYHYKQKLRVKPCDESFYSTCT